MASRLMIGEPSKSLEWVFLPIGKADCIAEASSKWNEKRLCHHLIPRGDASKRGKHVYMEGSCQRDNELLSREHVNLQSSYIKIS